ncbi:MAG: hypothetical protein CVV27_00025 [Candidatus Melainabacteria bacterium HGW-Melainabacteria-1]|nr:MAG: hypothetical protein CVV27_00025 [Candidatus Melainabacteria bacterium HGW-Melainabacteria-1]
MTDKSIGLDRYLQIGWLDLALRLARENRSVQDARPLLEDRLLEEISGLEARKKTITVLNRVWLNPPAYLSQLQQEALDLSLHISPEEHLALHWGMLQTIYPFFYTVVSHTGRLLQLQGQTSRIQIRRRVIEEYGERISVERAVGMALQSLLHWRVIRESKQIIQADQQIGLSLPVVFWLARALVLRRDSGMLNFSALTQEPALFPFSLPPLTARDFESQGFEVLAQAFGGKLLMLTKSRTRPASI